MRVLVLGDLVAYPDPLKPIGKGYVYMVDGKVEAVARQPVPPEHQDADLVVGGRGRAVLPARTAALIHATLYPVRYRVWGRDPYEEPWVQDYLARLDCEAAWAASMLGLYEASLAGTGHVVLEDPHARCVERAVEEAGLDAVIAVPAGCLEGYEWSGDTASAGRAAVSACSEDIDAPGGIPVFGHGVEPEEAIAVFYPRSPVRSLPIVTPSHGSEHVSKQGFALGIGAWARYDPVAAALSLSGSAPPLAKLVEAMHVSRLVPSAHQGVIVVRIDSAPGMVDVSSWGTAAYLSTGPVETLIVGDNVVVDGGDNIMLGEERLAEARETLRGVLDHIYG